MGDHSCPTDEPSKPHCCTFYQKPNFEGESENFCIVREANMEQKMFDLRGLERINQDWNLNGSIICGPQASVTICPSDSVIGEVQGVERFVCSSTNEDATTVGAHERKDFVNFKNSSIVISYWPWATKGPYYIALDRQRKAEVIWDKIREDPTMGPQSVQELLNIDMTSPFDTLGDEFDCRNKSGHSFGNVAKVEWRDFGDHNFTGMFKGADTGFIRTSDLVAPCRGCLEGGGDFANPGIAVKLLRDGMDSGNALAKLPTRFGQNDYNFFLNELTSITTENLTQELP